MALPTLTDEQRREAVEKAQAARRARKELKASIKRGEVSLTEVLDSEGPVVERMRVWDLLRALPGIGEAKAKKLMQDCGIAESKRVGGLGCRQREKLREAFDEMSL